MSTTDTQAIPAGAWTLDPLHSTVGFSVQYAVARYRSGFRSFDASLEVAQDGQLTLTGSVEVETIAIDEASFRQHVLGEDFFDAAQHPQLGFASTAIRRNGEQVEVEGELTLRGVTQQVTGTGTLVGPLEAAFGGEVLGLQVTAEVDRSAFGMTWNAPLPKGGDALSLKVALEIDLQLKAPE